MCDSPRDKTLGLFYKAFKRGQTNKGGSMIEIDTEETKNCEECPTILDIDDFFLCQDCEEEQEKA